MEMGFPPDGAEALSLSSAVDCRIGSLEIILLPLQTLLRVDCRIGSLEIAMVKEVAPHIVDCRIGSLEIDPEDMV